MLGLNRDLHQTFWEVLGSEVIPLIKQLLQDIPGDYEGKKDRGKLVNGLLSARNLAILIHDDHGRPHLCSVQPVRARESDTKGNLRLLERTASGSSRRSYPIPSPDKLEIVEIPHHEIDTEQKRPGGGRS